MANATVNASIRFTNYTQSTAPYTTKKMVAGTDYKISPNGSTARDRNYVFGKITIPDVIRHRPIVGFALTMAMKNVRSDYSPSIWVSEDYDEDTLNYSNQPTSETQLAVINNDDASGSYKNITSTYTIHSVDLARLMALCQTRALFVYAGPYSYLSNTGGYTRTTLSNGSTLPYIAITYDDSIEITSELSYDSSQLSGTVNPAVAKTMTWSLVKASEWAGTWCPDETWEQVSAVFSYRESGESTWQTINISGATTRVTIPAYTFDSDKTYQYKITATDDDGTTSETSVYTFTTARSQITPVNSPTSGYVNPREATTFSWKYLNSFGEVNGGPSDFDWVDSESAWGEHLVHLEAGVNTITIPANTFPAADYIHWMVSGQDSTGQTSESDEYLFSTTASVITATAVSPSNSIESNNQEITFTWTFSSNDGFEASRYRLLYRLSTDTEWTSLVDTTTIATSYTAAPNTFPAGEIQWKITPYNIDGVEGVSSTASFVSYGAPTAPVVYATSVPFTTITWQAGGQQAYEIVIDDVTYGLYFGVEKSFEVPEALSDGQHIIKVRVIGTYNLWSDYGTTIVDILNSPGESITLSGESGVSNTLTWVTAEETHNYFVYRDGNAIGHTSRKQFEDRLANGENTYKVINKLNDGNYSESNEVTLETQVDGVYIAPLYGGNWVNLKYYVNDRRDPEYEETLETSYNHLAGQTFPSVILSKRRDTVVSSATVFISDQTEEQDMFEAMFGKPVIMKFIDDRIVVGVLDSMTRRPKGRIYTEYTFSIRQMEWGDYVDDTDS